MHFTVSLLLIEGNPGDALLSDRPYREAWEPDRAKECIGGHAGDHFDPKVVEFFLRRIA